MHLSQLRSQQRARRQAEQLFMQVRSLMKSNYLVSEPAGYGGNFIVSRDGTGRTLSSNLAYAISRAPVQWYTIGYAICKDHTGNQYIRELDAVTLKRPTSYANIYRQVQAEVLKMVKRYVNQNHFISAGWIASATPRPLEPSVAFEVLAMHGVYDKHVPYMEYDQDAPSELISKLRAHAPSQSAEPNHGETVPPAV